MTRLQEPQVKVRERLDEEITERAYERLANSVSSKGVARIAYDDFEQVNNAARACLANIGVNPGDVPADADDLEDVLDAMCRPSGTLHRRVRLEEGWQHKVVGTMLGRLKTGEPVALLPRSIRGYRYLEPGTKQKVKVTAAIAQRIEREAVLFYRPLPEKPLTTRDLLRFIFRSFDVYDHLLVVGSALTVALIGLAPAWANKIAFSVVAPSGKAELILPIGALLLGTALSSILIAICRNLVTKSMASKAEVETMAALYARLLSLPASFFKQYSTGNLGSRIKNARLLVRKLITTFWGSGLTAVFALVYIIQIFAFAPSLAIPAFAIVVAQAALTVAITIINRRHEARAKQVNVRLAGIETALLSSVQKIKLAGAEKRAFARWAGRYADFCELEYNRPAIVRALPALVASVGLVGTVIIYYLAATSGTSIADFMAFSAAYGQVSAALMEFASIAGNVSEIRPLLELESPILEAAPENDEDKPSVEALSGAIELTNVAFRYGEDSPYIFKNLSFEIKAGEYVALVGKSGCGKSTILRLLLGFEMPESGSVLYGSYDTQQVNLRSMRQHIGTVMQDGKLFAGDIYSNIILSTPRATVDDAWRAAEIAGIADDIRDMPQGMNTLVGEGSGGISGGQRQRLMIARAVCGNRRILMFDEATSALDNKTQKKISDALDAMSCTRVVVAHRLSTVKHCDRILVVDGGRIAEEGTFDELLAKDGLFAELVSRQRIDGGR